MQAILLAAGKSERFWPLNLKHKSLFKILGKPIIWYTIQSLRKAGIKDIIVVQNKNKEIEKEIGRKNIEYVVQEKPKGMGNAILQAKDLIKDDFFVLNAERFDASNFLNLMIEKSKETKAKMVLLASKTAQPWLYGILELEGDKAKNLIEKPAKAKTNLKVVGIYLLPKDFFDYYAKVKEGQYAFEDALQLYIKAHDVRVVITDKETHSLKYPWDLFKFKKTLMNSFLKPEIARSAKISKNVVIEGKVFIGENTKIFENAVIKGPCWIGNNCIIGNNALVRDYTDLEDGVMIGANCEVTRSIIQNNSHIHSGFIGDSIIADNCRIGAGIITANVRIDRQEIKAKVKGEKIETGLKSFGAIIGANTKFGIRVNTMPGILIGNNCTIGPNSIVKENIENDITFYTKFKEVIKK